MPDAGASIYWDAGARIAARRSVPQGVRVEIMMHAVMREMMGCLALLGLSRVGPE